MKSQLNRIELVTRPDCCLFAAGEAVCRPISGGLIADVFSPNARALANGVFSWGVYFGYGLAYVIGINLTSAGTIQMHAPSAPN